MAKDKGKKAKGASKKSKSEPMKWAKIVIPLLMILVVIGMIIPSVLTGSKINSSSTTSSSLSKSFDNIRDALNILPTGVSYLRYVDLKNDSQVNNWMQSYYFNTLPTSQVFGASPVRDALAIYPEGYFGDVQTSSVGDVMSLTDFGNGTLNDSYSWANSNTMRKINSYYYFSPESSPVVSGGANAVSYTLNALVGNVNSSYNDYADLFDELRWKQVSTANMTLETVGNNCTIPISNVNLTVDRFYAGIGATNETMVVNNTTYVKYSYVVALHVNQTPSDSDAKFLYLLESSNEKMGFSDYGIQIYGDYIIIQAHGPMVVCAYDMMTWGFMKYAASST